MKLNVLVVVASIAISTTAAQAEPPLTPLGRWVTESGNFEVDVSKCGEALCGTVVKVMANRSMSSAGAEMQAADTRPALGMTILSGFRPAGGGEFKGEIYNRENAKNYTATITPAKGDQLLVRGYVLLPIFGKTQVWRRPAPDLGAAQ
jgi:uncharacterized protein (DUF2147 family)